MSEPREIEKKQFYNNNSTRISKVTTHWCRNSIGLIAYHRCGFFIDFGLIPIIRRQIGWPDYSQTNTRFPKEHKDRINDMILSQDGCMLFTCSDDRCIIAWDLPMTKVSRKFESAHTGSIKSLDYFDESGLLVSAGADHKIIVWQTHTQDPLLYASLEGGHTGSVNIVKFNNDGKFIISSSDDGSIRVWSSISNCCVNCIIVDSRTLGSITALIPLNNNIPDAIITAHYHSNDGCITMWNGWNHESDSDMPIKKKTMRMSGINCGIMNLSINCDQTMIAACLASRILFFRCPEMIEVSELKITKKWSQKQVQFHPYEPTVLMIANSRDIEFYCLISRKIIRKMQVDCDFTDESTEIRSISLTPEGSTLIVGASDGCIYTRPLGILS